MAVPERPRLTPATVSAVDAAHVWHPYATIGVPGTLPPLVAEVVGMPRRTFYRRLKEYGIQ